MDFIKLAEPIHPVIQGEGSDIGKKMFLLRLSGCNVNCLNCDSKHTWNTIYNEYTANALIDEINKLNRKYEDVFYLLISGGNPEIQKKELCELINKLCTSFYWKFNIEVPGLVNWRELEHFYNRIQFNFSPKIGSLHKNQSLDVWKAFNDIPTNYNVKIVVKEETFDKDLKEIKAFSDIYRIPHRKIMLMPQGTTREEIIKESQFLIPKCFELGFQFSPRLHVLIYDNKKLV